MSKIQNEDVKSEAQLLAAGAQSSQLINDSKIWVTGNSINKRLDNAIIDGDIGGGAGGINYILNGRAVSSTTGWATYADAAGSQPIDGTGGSANVTWTRSTTTPLRGAAHFLFTKDAANRQGQGVSDDFTIDVTDQAKVLEISFDWSVISGTFNGSVIGPTTSDIVVYIYDITNARLIEPSTRLLDPAIVGVYNRYSATFQTASNSTSYRLIFHVARTSVDAYSIAFDNISVGPQLTVRGAPLIDWTQPGVWTPTGSWTSNTTYLGSYAQHGDMVLFQVRVSCSGVPTPSSVLTINLPTGMVIDTTKIPGIEDDTNIMLDGSGTAFDAGTRAYIIVPVWNDTTSVAFRPFGQAASHIDLDARITPTSLFSFVSSDYINVSFRLPIVGFSSSLELANSTTTRVVSFRQDSTASQAVTANVTNIAGSGATNRKDTHGAWTGSTYVVQVPGDYVFGAKFTSNVSTYSIYLNGSLYDTLFTVSVNGLTENGSIIVPDLRAGDIISWRSGTTLTVTSGTMFGHRISGPSQIAARETIACRYNSINVSVSAETTLIFTSKSYDSHGLYNTTTGTWICPASGLYQLNIAIITSPSSLGTTGALQVGYRINGGVFQRMDWVVGNGATAERSADGFDIANLVAGDLIQFRGIASTAATFSGGYMCIMRVGQVG